MFADPQMKNTAEQIKRLEEKVKRLEAYQEYRKHFLSLNEGEVVIRAFGGQAEIRLKKSGDISIKGNKVTIVGSHKVFVKSSDKLVLKGSTIDAN